MQHDEMHFVREIHFVNEMSLRLVKCFRFGKPQAYVSTEEDGEARFIPVGRGLAPAAKTQGLYPHLRLIDT